MKEKKVKVEGEAVLTPAMKTTGVRFIGAKFYFEQRLTALNRRACLHKGAPCAVRARAEITGMLTVINELGYEADGDWDRYDSEIFLMPVKDFASKQKGGAK